MTESTTTGGRVWIDMTNSPHVLVLRPVIDEFRRRGWDVTVTAREFAQTLPLLERFSASAERSVMIGDGINDILLARNSGILSCSFLEGLTDRTILTQMNPDLCFGHFQELPRLFT